MCTNIYNQGALITYVQYHEHSTTHHDCCGPRCAESVGHDSSGNNAAHHGSHISVARFQTHGIQQPYLINTELLPHYKDHGLSTTNYDRYQRIRAVEQQLPHMYRRAIHRTTDTCIPARQRRVFFQPQEAHGFHSRQQQQRRSTATTKTTATTEHHNSPPNKMNPRQFRHTHTTTHMHTRTNCYCINN